MNAKTPPYKAEIIPVLHHIQHEHGYLKREALEAYARSSGIPLFKLQTVASFFPHFRMTPPPTATVYVCRDMACHMFGAGVREELEQTAAAAGGQVQIKGVSCLGRCDRPPSVCVSVHKTPLGVAHRAGRDAHAAHAAGGHGGDHGGNGSHDAHHGHGGPPTGEGDYYYHGKSREELGEIVQQCVALSAAVRAAEANPASVDRGLRQAPLPPPTLDVDLAYKAADWEIDPYKGNTPEYNAIKKAVKLRSDALDRAVAKLQEMGWTRRRAEQFRLAAESRLDVDFPLDPELVEAVRDWQTEDRPDPAKPGRRMDGWFKGPELGGWADALLKELDDAHADLRGLGGAGIPATTKWRDVREAIRNARKRGQDERAFIVVNGDESEPATFKDREILLKAPHTVIEGVILAGIITDASQGFIYIRHEYPEQIAACDEEIKHAEEVGVCGPAEKASKVLGRAFPVSTFTSPGGYICGEQSALIEAMEDHRSEPRNMPPKLETNGLIDRPTLVSNVETYAWAPYIIINGGAAYAARGANGWKGRRFFSISGDVERPGVYEVPMGMTLRKLIDACGGIKDGRQFKAFAPSGPSGGFLPAFLKAKENALPRKHTENRDWKALAGRRGFDVNAQELDLLDMELELNLFRALSPTSALGAGLVVYADHRDMADQAVNALEFYRSESCGKCVPCRIGSQKLVALGHNLLGGRIDAGTWKERVEPVVAELGKAMEQASICGLGRSVPVPLRTTVSFFRPDVDHYLGAGGPGGNGAAGIGGGHQQPSHMQTGGAAGMAPPHPAGAVAGAGEATEVQP